MPKNTDVLGIIAILLILNRKTNIVYDLHKMTEFINKLDRISTTATSLPDLNSIMDKVAPILSALNSGSLPNYDSYDDENENAIF